MLRKCPLRGASSTFFEWRNLVTNFHFGPDVPLAPLGKLSFFPESVVPFSRMDFTGYSVAVAYDDSIGRFIFDYKHDPGYNSTSVITTCRRDDSLCSAALRT